MKCRHSPCSMTLGIYVGGGQAVCWYHLLLFYGKAAALLWKEAPHIALTIAENVLSSREVS